MSNIQKEDFARKLRFDAQLRPEQSKGSFSQTSLVFVVLFIVVLTLIAFIVLHFSGARYELKAAIWALPLVSILFAIYSVVKAKKKMSRRREDDMKDHGRKTGNAEYWGRGK